MKRIALALACLAFLGAAAQAPAFKEVTVTAEQGTRDIISVDGGSVAFAVEYGSYQTFSPDDSRAIAKALNDAADAIDAKRVTECEAVIKKAGLNSCHEGWFKREKCVEAGGTADDCNAIFSVLGVCQ